jgi:hypothetical protein
LALPVEGAPEVDGEPDEVCVGLDSFGDVAEVGGFWGVGGWGFCE